MSKTEPVVLTNMCMVYDGTKVLLQDRKNPNWPGLCFPGGHVDPFESFTDSVIREVKEETGLDVKNVKLCGIKQVARRDDGYRYIVLFYKTNEFSGELVSSSEGEMIWVERDEIDESRVAHGFMEMLRVFEDDSIEEVYLEKNNGEWKSILK